MANPKKSLLTHFFILALISALFITGFPPAAAALPEADGQGHMLPTLAPMLDKTTPAVVNISTRGRVRTEDNPLLQDPFFRRFFGAPLDTPRERPTQSLGSGVIIDAAKGYILTNNHVIAKADEITVTLRDGRTLTAKLVGADPDTDVAVIQIPAKNIVALPIADSEKLRVGDFVVAIGNPFGLGQTVTSGIVSALQRLITAPNQFAIDHVIQTDAPINPGNSGGPLLDARGQVIGVNTQIETGTGTSASGNVGIGFAVPSNTVKDVVAQILRNGRVDHAYLGIRGQAVTKNLADTFNLPVRSGVLVETVLDGSGAAKAGLQAGETEVVVAGETYVLGGDIIVSFEGTKISSIQELRDAISGKKPGDKVTLAIYRDGSKTSVTVTLGRQPASPQG